MISQIVTLGIYIRFFAAGKTAIKIGMSYFKPSRETYSEMIKIGISTLLLQLFQSLSMSLISNTASHYGDEAVAAMGIVLRIVTIGANCNLRRTAATGAFASGHPAEPNGHLH